MRFYKLILHGNVQGVSFRYYTKKKAEELGIKGTVRNLPDETVEVIAQDSPAIESFLKWCETGPSSAIVEKIESEIFEDGKGFTDFRIIH